MAALTDKQRAFVEYYLANGFNGTQAALSAGYAEKGARQQAAETLAKPYIRELIEARIKEIAMSADEALARLSEMARASMEDFIDADTATLNLAKAKANGKLHLVRKFTHNVGKETENISIELYDAQSALLAILKERHLEAGEPTESFRVDVSRLTDDELEAIARAGGS